MTLSPDLEAPAVARERVALGDAYLTAELPGYEAYVDPGELRMANGNRCLLAQLYENDPRLAAIEPTREGDTPYIAVLRHLIDYDPCERASITWDVERGFHTAYLGDDVEYEDLDDAWRELLIERRARLDLRTDPPKAPVSMTAAEDEAFSDEYDRRMNGE